MLDLWSWLSGALGAGIIGLFLLGPMAPVIRKKDNDGTARWNAVDWMDDDFGNVVIGNHDCPRWPTLFFFF
jgi:hypothetical protein